MIFIFSLEDGNDCLFNWEKIITGVGEEAIKGDVMLCLPKCKAVPITKN